MNKPTVEESLITLLQRALNLRLYTTAAYLFTDLNKRFKTKKAKEKLIELIIDPNWKRDAQGKIEKSRFNEVSAAPRFRQYVSFIKDNGFILGFEVTPKLIDKRVASMNKKYFKGVK